MHAFWHPGASVTAESSATLIVADTGGFVRMYGDACAIATWRNCPISPWITLAGEFTHVLPAPQSPSLLHDAALFEHLPEPSSGSAASMPPRSASIVRH